jgi:hypothetical protein
MITRLICILTSIEVIDVELRIFRVAISMRASAATVKKSINSIKCLLGLFKTSLMPQLSPSNVSPQTQVVLSIK